jgi:hypothetical protein
MDTCTEPAPALDDWAEAVKLASEMDAAAAARARQESDEAPGADRLLGPSD